MADERGAHDRVVRRTPRTRTVVIIIALVALVAGGITVTSVSAAQAYAEETTRLCTIALKSGAQATTSAENSIVAADAALDAVESTALPDTDGWTSTDYALRHAGDGRSSAAELISAVSDASAVLARIAIPERCTERDKATTIASQVTRSDDAAASLDERVAALTEDFAAFQADEIARISAEKEAVRHAAAEEAVQYTRRS